MNAQSAAKWARIQSKGKSRYLLYNGVLPFAVTVTLLLTLIEYATTGTIYPAWLVVRPLLFGVVGFFWANIMWNRWERKAAKSRGDNN